MKTLKDEMRSLHVSMSTSNPAPKPKPNYKLIYLFTNKNNLIINPPVSVSLSSPGNRYKSSSCIFFLCFEAFCVRIRLVMNLTISLITLEGIGGGGGEIKLTPSLDFLALNFCCFTNHPNLWCNCSLFVNTSFDAN